ncbi:MAG: putative lipid II flippase FtsW [Planctomycetes bacterium]|nr:putative lipid II flippase FtsW [Planctomycetota bacterium]
MDAHRRTLLLLTGLLLALGLTMVYSASFVFAEKKFGSPTFFLERHCVYLLAGCFAMTVGALWDYHRLARWWPWLLALAIVVLAGVLVPGVGERINGARRWYRLGSFTFQPSEMAKPLLIIGLAGWAVTRREKLRTFWRGFVPGALLVGGAVALVALEPDLGTGLLLFSILGSMLFVAGVRLIYAIPALGVALPAAAFLAWSRLEYIQNRIIQFVGGNEDPLGHGYQITQALMAQGSGGVWGVGLGQGAAKLLYLPEAHNDFILALIGEELGLAGTLAVIACFALFVWTGWRVACLAPDRLGALIAHGVTLLVGLQAAINIAVVTRTMPTKGISLPLVSYGGSSLVFTMLAIGLLLNVAAHPARGTVPAAPGVPPPARREHPSLAGLPVLNTTSPTA